MKKFDESIFDSLTVKYSNKPNYGSNKDEVLKNLDEDIEYVKSNGLKLKSKGKDGRLYELRCFKKPIDNRVRVGLRCRGKNVFLTESMYRGKKYLIADNDEKSVINAMKQYREVVEKNMSDRDDLYYGTKKMKVLESH